jgi:hypothetical protein
MFKVKNYTSFKDEVILDMRAASYKQHPTHILKTYDGEELLKTVAIYGANASGKSNLVSAMYFFRNYIFEQRMMTIVADYNEFAYIGLGPRLEPFLLSKGDNGASEFDIKFSYKNKIIQYGFECTSQEVINEWYFIDEKKVFERKRNLITYGDKYRIYIDKFNEVSEKRLYISVLDYFLRENDKAILLDDLISFLTEDFNIFSELFLESTIKQNYNSVDINKNFVNNEEYRGKIVEYLKQIDVGIKGLKMYEESVINQKTGKGKKEKILRTLHDIYDNDDHVCGEKEFDLQQESSGTLRFLAYIQRIVDMIDKGGVFVVDEMSSKLHPLLTKFIIDIFQSSGNTKAQLIFTTHDISLLNKEQFRRDEVVFIDKNQRGESSLYALSDLKVRDDATFNKDYLQGKYGAIPIFNYDGKSGGN